MKRATERDDMVGRLQVQPSQKLSLKTCILMLMMLLMHIILSTSAQNVHYLDQSMDTTSPKSKLTLVPGSPDIPRPLIFCSALVADPLQLEQLSSANYRAVLTLCTNLERGQQEKLTRSPKEHPHTLGGQESAPAFEFTLPEN